MFYSKSTNGFYTPEIHGENIPTDSVAITDEQYLALLNGQTEGKQIKGDDNGNPILVEPPVPVPVTAPTKEELMAKLLEIQTQLENLV
jgi:hypothetical protein